MKNSIKYFTVIFSILVLFSCQKKGDYTTIDKVQTQTAIHKIIVTETLDGGGYTYIHVDESGDAYWMAIPNTTIEIGETYYHYGGMVMRNFESKELKKTFDRIIFSDGIRLTEKIINTEKDTIVQTNSKNKKVQYEKIKQPKNGTSLIKLFSDKESFLKKEITVRGKVVKVNNGILDRNWVHIADGTGIENKKQLTITTNETVIVGAIVTFKGVITLNKDFGHGYVYDILLEEGELIK